MLGPQGDISSFWFSSSPGLEAVCPSHGSSSDSLRYCCILYHIGLSLGMSHQLAQAKHFVGSSFWFPKMTGIGSLQDMLVQFQLTVWREEMGRHRHSRTKQVEGREIHLQRGGGMRWGMRQGHKWTWSWVIGLHGRRAWVGDITFKRWNWISFSHLCFRGMLSAGIWLQMIFTLVHAVLLNSINSCLSILVKEGDGCPANLIFWLILYPLDFVYILSKTFTCIYAFDD